MTTVIATDLDRTLIYSARAAGVETAELVCVERYRDADTSFMTRAAADLLAGLGRSVVPTTTRTVEQLRRIVLPGPPARWAVAANGGVLLVDGVVDERWTRAVRRRVAVVAPLEEVAQHAAQLCRPEWTTALRTAEGLFCYAVLDRAGMPDGVVDETAVWARQHGWQVSLQGRKLYWVPQPLTKSAAVAEIVDRSGVGLVLAAGDSLLDADLLSYADAAVLARHGELHASGWSAPHVRVTEHRGAAAGEEIVRWFAETTTPNGPPCVTAASRPDPTRPERPPRARTAAG